MNLEVIDLGLVDFKAAWQKQKEVFRQVKEGLLDKALIICRNYPVITLGRSSDRKNILVTQGELTKRDIGVYEVERGGDVTYHGPGQLIVYPVLNLRYLKKDIHWFLRYLEGLIIASLGEFGIKGQRLQGLTGVWVGQSKIASIGIAISHWVTFHGLSINIKRNDLSNFSLIRPCGMDIMTTCVESCLGEDFEFQRVKESLIRGFENG